MKTLLLAIVLMTPLASYAPAFINISTMHKSGPTMPPPECCPDCPYDAGPWC